MVKQNKKEVTDSLNVIDLSVRLFLFLEGPQKKEINSLHGSSHSRFDC